MTRLTETELTRLNDALDGDERLLVRIDTELRDSNVVIWDDEN